MERAAESGLLAADQHTAYFSNAAQFMPSTQELTQFIRAYEKIVLAHREIFLRLAPDLRYLEISAELVKYEATGSGLLDWVIKLWWRNEEDALEWTKAKLAERYPAVAKILSDKKWGVFVLAVIACAGLYHCTRRNDAKEAADFPNLTEIHSQVIMMGAQELDVTPAELNAAILEVLKDNPSLLQDTARVVRPLRLDPNAYLRVDASTQLTLTPEAIAEIPPVLDADAQTKVVDHDGVLVVLRATDLDNKKRWGAIVPSISPRRVTLVVGLEDAGQLAGVVHLRGSVVVDYVMDEEGVWQPTRYTLTAVEATDRQSGLFQGTPSPAGDEVPQ